MVSATTVSATVATRRNLPRFDRNAAIQWSVAALTLLLVVVPLLPIFYQAFLDKPLYYPDAAATLGNFADLLGEPEFRTVIVNTFYFALVMTAIAQGIGVGCAILVGRTDLPGRRVFGDILLWPLFISHLVLAFGWFIMFGPSGYITLVVQAVLDVEPWNLYSLTGMGVVGGLAQAPLAYLYCIASATSVDASLEDAARSAGAGTWTVLRRVTLPLMRPSIIYGTIMNFVTALEVLSIPLVLGGPEGIEVFTTYLYNRVFRTSTPAYGLVAAASFFMLLLVMVLIAMQGRLMRDAARFVTVGGKATRPRAFPLGRWRWVAFAFMVAYVSFAIIAVIGGLALRSIVSLLSPLVPIWDLFTWDNFLTIASYPVYLRSISNTIQISIAAGLIGTALVALIVLVSTRSPFRFARRLEYVAMAPRAVPGIIAGIGILYAAALFAPLGWLRNTIWILVAAYVMRYIPAGFGSIAPSLGQISRDLDRGAHTVGADWWGTARSILVPLIRPALFSCFALIFILCFKEYVTAVFLFAPGSEVIGTTMLQFWQNGDNGPVSALATIQVGLTFLFVYAARRILGVRIYG
jgi:iron(III) transport system permease protein